MRSLLPQAVRAGWFFRQALIIVVRYRRVSEREEIKMFWKVFPDYPYQCIWSWQRASLWAQDILGWLSCRSDPSAAGTRTCYSCPYPGSGERLSDRNPGYTTISMMLSLPILRIYMRGQAFSWNSSVPGELHKLKLYQDPSYADESVRDYRLSWGGYQDACLQNALPCAGFNGAPCHIDTASYSVKRLVRDTFRSINHGGCCKCCISVPAETFLECWLWMATREAPSKQNCCALSRETRIELQCVCGWSRTPWAVAISEKRSFCKQRTKQTTGEWQHAPAGEKGYEGS